MKVTVAQAFHRLDQFFAEGEHDLEQGLAELLVKMGKAEAVAEPAPTTGPAPEPAQEPEQEPASEPAAPAPAPEPTLAPEPEASEAEPEHLSEASE